MKKTRIFSFVLAVLMALSTFVIGVAAADGIAKSDNVVFVANSGSDDAAGTVDAPVATLAKAVEKLAATGGVAVIMGQVTIEGYKDETGMIAGNSVMPAHTGLITVTSYYDGVDYRAKMNGSDATGARIILNNGTAVSFNLQGDYLFDYVDICIPAAAKKQPIIACNYNDVTFGENIKMVFEDVTGLPWYEGDFACSEYPTVDPRLYPPIVLAGKNIEDATGVGTVAEPITVTEPCTITVKSGTWQSFRIGDRDVPFRNTIDTTVNLNIEGGTFTQWTGKYDNSNTNLCVMAHYQVCTTENFVGNVNITGGIFHGEIGGFGTYGPASYGDALEEGVINININGGTFKRDYGGQGPIIQPSQYLPFGYANLMFGEKHAVNVNIDTSKITVDSAVPFIQIIGRDELVNVNVNLDAKNDLVYVEETVPLWCITYAGVPAGEKPAETEPPVTTEAPATEPPATEPVTDAPKTEPVTEPTTKAPETNAPATQAPSTPAPADDGGSALPVIIAIVAAVVVIAVVVVIIIKKKKA